MESDAARTKIYGGLFGLEVTSCYFSVQKRDTNCLKVRVADLLIGLSQWDNTVYACFRFCLLAILPWTQTPQKDPVSGTKSNLLRSRSEFRRMLSVCSALLEQTLQSLRSRLPEKRKQ